MVEEWKKIRGYKGEYQISNLGRVKSLKFGREKILRNWVSPNGFLICNLYKNGTPRCYVVQYLVNKAFNRKNKRLKGSEL